MWDVKSYPEQKPKSLPFLHVAAEGLKDRQVDRQVFSAASERLNPDSVRSRAGGEKWGVVERGRRDYRERERDPAGQT